jgi:hypothetical protein
VLWFSVWFVLVAGTLLGAFLLGRRLWRSGKALLAEMDRAGEVVGRLEALQEQARERFPAPVPPPPAIGAWTAQRDRFRAARLAHREAAGRRRVLRLNRAMRHWRQVGTPL